jgi:HSP20 family molecular chaperone IbpA
MKARKFVSNELIASIDVLNTLNGGVSKPLTKLKQFEGHREIRVKVPGVKEENLKVEIHNHVLRVFYSILVISDGLTIEVPKVVYNKPIPYFVDATRITAVYEDRFLIVTLPFNSLTEGYQRKISIES